MASIKRLHDAVHPQVLVCGGDGADLLDLASGAVYLDDRRASHDSALFVEDQYTISDKLLLNAGVRSDRYQAFGSTTNPRLALIFKPVAKTAIKALWGTAFRAPDAYELFYTTDLLTANPRLNPETIRTGELLNGTFRNATVSWPTFTAATFEA